MSPAERMLWEKIAIVPEKWQQHPYGDQGGGFWVGAIIGKQIIWFNDIEGGWNISGYSSHGQFTEYWCNQDELEWVIHRIVEPEHTTYFRSQPKEEGCEDDRLHELNYQCLNCCNSFILTVTDLELKGSLDQSRMEACPACGQRVDTGPACCRNCQSIFILDFPHWHMKCDLAGGNCPACGTKYVSPCIC